MLHIHWDVAHTRQPCLGKIRDPISTVSLQEVEPCAELTMFAELVWLALLSWASPSSAELSCADCRTGLSILLEDHLSQGSVQGQVQVGQGFCALVP